VAIIGNLAAIAVPLYANVMLCGSGDSTGADSSGGSTCP